MLLERGVDIHIVFVSVLQQLKMKPRACLAQDMCRSVCVRVCVAANPANKSAHTPLA